MKTIKITLASLLVFAFTGLASAQSPVVLHITGSTAYRAATLVAISNILESGYQVAYVASAAEPYSKANMVLFTGTTTSGVAVQIKTAFFGSIGGVADVAGGLTVGPNGTAYTDGQTIGWLSTSNPTLPGSVSNGVVSGGQNIVSTAAIYDTAVAPDCTMSDSFQASAPSAYQTPRLKGKIVGVVPFVFVCSPGTTTSSGTVSNLTSANARKLLGGTLKLNNLTGKSTDSAVHVYAVGRDQDSGTRIAALADTAYGITKDVQQYQPEFNGAPVSNPPPTPSGSITGAALWPATQPVDTINSPTGDSGYNSGSLVGTAIAQTSSYTNWFIAYLGLNDALTGLANTKNFTLEFNGGSLTETSGTWDVAGVEDGSYTFWGYEHFLYGSSLTGKKLTVAQLIEKDILNTTAPISGVAISDMTVHRNDDGGPIKTGGTPPNTP